MAKPAEAKVKEAVGKIVLVTEHPLTKPELVVLYKFFPSIRRFDPELEAGQPIGAILAATDLLIIDISSKAGLKYYSSSIGRLLDHQVVLRVKPGQSLDVEAARKRFSADHVIKYLPTDFLDKEDFIARLLSDHISQPFRKVKALLAWCGCL